MYKYMNNPRTPCTFTQIYAEIISRYSSNMPKYYLLEFVTSSFNNVAPPPLFPPAPQNIQLPSNICHAGSVSNQGYLNGIVNSTSYRG